MINRTALWFILAGLCVFMACDTATSPDSASPTSPDYISAPIHIRIPISADLCDYVFINYGPHNKTIVMFAGDTATVEAPACFKYRRICNDEQNIDTCAYLPGKILIDNNFAIMEAK